MIFISYAKEDANYAGKLYLALKSSGLNPWMDKPPHPYQGDGLLLGQKWRTVLESKLHEAKHILLILSPRSVKKRGFVQNEFRIALNIMNTLPDDGVFVLPILSEKCEVPSLKAGQIDLTDLQWEEVKEGDIDEFAGRLFQQIGIVYQ